MIGVNNPPSALAHKRTFMPSMGERWSGELHGKWLGKELSCHSWWQEIGTLAFEVPPIFVLLHVWECSCVWGFNHSPVYHFNITKMATAGTKGTCWGGTCIAVKQVKWSDAFSLLVPRTSPLFCCCGQMSPCLVVTDPTNLHKKGKACQRINCCSTWWCQKQHQYYQPIKEDYCD